MENKELKELRNILIVLGATKKTKINYLDTNTDVFYQIKDFKVFNDSKKILIVGQGIVEDGTGKQINDTLVSFNVVLEDIEDIDIDICGINITYVDGTVISLELENADVMTNILDNIENTENTDWNNLNNSNIRKIEKIYADYYKEENAKSIEDRQIEDLKETNFNLKNIITKKHE